MLKKKLLTLACVLGILACGACFGPVHYKPPEPPPISMEDIRIVRVAVTGEPDSNRLHLSAVAYAIVDRFNAASSYTRVAAYLDDGSPTIEDAFLEVRILSESANLQSTTGNGGLAFWKFNIGVAETLTKRNGQTVWAGKEFTNTLPFNSYVHDENEVWKDPSAQAAILRSLANRIVFLATQQPPGASAVTQEALPPPK